MKTKLLLRIASGLMLFHLIAHSFGHSGWKNPPEAAQQDIIRAMAGEEFPFMGAMRSIGDFYDGYGWASSVALLFFVLVLWFLSGAADENRSLVSKLLWSLVICLFAWGILEFIFFFPFAAIITLLACSLTLIPAVRLRK